MRVIITGICVLAAAVLIPLDGTQAQARIGLDIQNGEVRNFFLAIGEYYSAPVGEIEVVREQGIPEDEVPVVYCVARYSGYEPADIAQMRLNGDSWMDISARCGVGPGVYSVDGYRASGPPYGNAYGYYKHRGRPGWGRTYYSDNDIITSVNARWMHERYGCSAPDVVRWRSHGESFRSIYGRFRSNHGRGSDERSGNDGEHGNPHGNHHGNHGGRDNDD